MVALIKKTFYLTLWIADRIVPKHQVALISTWPDFDDQGLAIEAELLRRGISFRWTVRRTDATAPSWDGAGVRPVVSRHSLAGLYAYLRSDLLFYTHGFFGFAPPPRSRTVVNLWHGMPVKAIAALHGNSPVRFTFTLATSQHFKELLERAFCVPPPSVQICGLPRNDRMLEAAAKSPSLEFLRDNIILWMPTYRRSVTGEIRVDGTQSDSIGGIPDFDLDEFDSVLHELDLKCIIKPHPMADPKTYPRGTDRIKLWTDSDIVSLGLTLYQLIAAADLLISDASSVWIDYLLLDRPILFAFGDHAEYESSRGFASEDGISNFPGPLVELQERLIQELRIYKAGTDSYAEQRRLAAAKFHQHHDGHSARRTVDHGLRLRKGHDG